MTEIKGKRIIHWTDPEYLDEFYKGWGSGQSTTSRQAPSSKKSEKTVDSLIAPRNGTQKRPGKV